MFWYDKTSYLSPSSYQTEQMTLLKVKKQTKKTLITSISIFPVHFMQVFDSNFLFFNIQFISHPFLSIFIFAHSYIPLSFSLCKGLVMLLLQDACV